MKIGIIGAGFTGMSAAYKLSKKGHTVIIFEKDSSPGGLALGFNNSKWNWSLEKHYHHWFTNDKSILNLAKKINYPIITKRPKTSVYIKDKIFQLDSPLNIFTFTPLDFISRLRMGFVLGFLKLNPLWEPLEGVRASDFLPKTMGKQAYKLLWEPQLKNKFGIYANEISMAWFWARIKKRTPSLSYPEGGFLKFANHLSNEIEKKGGEFLFNTEVLKIKSNGKIIVKSNKGNFEFDKLIVTLPSFFFVKIAPDLPNDYKESLLSLKGLGALNLVLRLKEQFLKDNTYWLSICDASPVMAIVEHTNFMNKKHYNKEHIVYLGNYLPLEHPYFKLDANAILKIYDKFLRKINPSYKKNILDLEIFKTPFAQPIIPINYSQILPEFKTPLPNVYLANIQQVYPWDRGTNYAVELGEKISDLIFNE